MHTFAQNWAISAGYLPSKTRLPALQWSVFGSNSRFDVQDVRKALKWEPDLKVSFAVVISRVAACALARFEGRRV